jgi:hypothetical protein
MTTNLSELTNAAGPILSLDLGKYKSTERLAELALLHDHLGDFPADQGVVLEYDPLNPDVGETVADDLQNSFAFPSTPCAAPG